MVTYDSGAIYIQSASTLSAKITRIDAIITALENAALSAAANEHLTEYSLDSGQTKIKAAYRGSSDIIKAIKSFEQLRNMYVERCNGRTVRLVDSKNLSPRRYRHL